MTGAQFWSYLQQKLDKSYSAYLDNTKANSLISEGFFRMLDKFWFSQSFEREADEMNAFIIKDRNVQPVAGVCKINIGTTGAVDEIPFYLHVISVLSNFEESLVVTASGTTLTSLGHKLRKGSIIVLGATTYTVSKVNGDTFQAKTSAGAFATTAGTYTWKYSKDAFQMASDRQGGAFHKANLTTPRFEFLYNGTQKIMRIVPSPVTANIDYIRTPPQAIDVANTLIDLNAYYSNKLLYRLMDECVVIFGAQTKDYNTKQSGMQDIVDNP
jgi:hypothetical protein